MRFLLLSSTLHTKRPPVNLFFTINSHSVYVRCISPFDSAAKSGTKQQMKPMSQMTNFFIPHPGYLYLLTARWSIHLPPTFDAQRISTVLRRYNTSGGRKNQARAQAAGAGVLMQGFTSCLRHDSPPHPGALAARPTGKRPCAFPRTSFAASVKKICLIGAILNNDGLRSAAAAELRQPLHSRPQCSGALGNPF